jgi:peptide/nickel transport system substrate-binding protein
MNCACARRRWRSTPTRQAADLTCQLVTPGFPGHSPYCPYTADPIPGGGWTAPDLDRARRLVAASGRAGARVTVDAGVEESRRAGPYFVSLLHDLGFHARLHVFPAGSDYFAEVQRRDARKQMGVYGWGPDYMSPSSLLDPTFGCTARGDPKPNNVSHVCDARLQAGLDRARAAAAEDAPAAWAAVDRRIVDLAAAVPYSSGRSITFVSKRVGNVTFHPMYNTLLDQIWVR